MLIEYLYDEYVKNMTDHDDFKTPYADPIKPKIKPLVAMKINIPEYLLVALSLRAHEVHLSLETFMITALEQSIQAERTQRKVPLLEEDVVDNRDAAWMDVDWRALRS